MYISSSNSLLNITTKFLSSVPTYSSGYEPKLDFIHSPGFSDQKEEDILNHTVCFFVCLVWFFYVLNSAQGIMLFYFINFLFFIILRINWYVGLAWWCNMLCLWYWHPLRSLVHNQDSCAIFHPDPCLQCVKYLGLCTHVEDPERNPRFQASDWLSFSHCILFYVLLTSYNAQTCWHFTIT